MVHLNANYEKNIQALKNVDIVLATKIIQSAMGESFELSVINADHQLYNILDHMHERAVYHNIIDELQEQITILKKQADHPFIYLFGIGNGYTLPLLLENKNHTRITIFEVDLELLFVTLHIYDFSEAILLGRLKFFHQKSFSFAQAVHLFKEHQSYYHTKNFGLVTSANYYTRHFLQEFETLQTLLIQALSYHLNHIRDFEKQSLYFKNQHRNLELQLASYQLDIKQEKRTQPKWSVIINQTLKSDQAKILANLQDRITIISTQSVLIELLKHNIRPDLVTVIEDHQELYKMIPSDIQSKLTMLIPNHYQELISFEKHTNKVIIDHTVDHYYNLHPIKLFTYHTDALSFAFECSHLLDHSHTIILDESITSENQLGFQNLAYLSSLYKDQMKSYRIKQEKIDQLECQPKSLQELHDLIIKHQVVKSPISLFKLDDASINALKSRRKVKSKDLFVKANILFDKIQNSLQEIQPWYEKLDQLEGTALLHHYHAADISSQVDTISRIRSAIGKDKSYQHFFHDFLEPSMILTYIEMASIQSATTLTPDEYQAKALQWAIINYQWLNQLHHAVYETLKILQEELDS